MRHEIWIDIPQGSELVGTKTDGDRVCIIYETNPNYRPIGYCLHEVEDEEYEDEDRKHSNIKCNEKNRKKS